MIQPVNALTPKVSSRGSVVGYKNASRLRTERRLALVNATGISVVLGAVTTAVTRSITSCWKNASFLGIGAGAISMMFLLPAFMYKAGVYAKSTNESDVFSSEKKILTSNGLETKKGSLQTTFENYSKTLVRKAV